MSSKSFRLEWKGEKVIEDVTKASVAATDEALEAAVARARSSHPSWNDRTGETARSLQVISRAVTKGGAVIGSVGSRLRNFIYLEIGHHGRRGDRTIYRAVTLEGQDLDERIAKKLPSGYR